MTVMGPVMHKNTPQYALFISAGVQDAFLIGIYKEIYFTYFKY